MKKHFENSIVTRSSIAQTSTDSVSCASMSAAAEAITGRRFAAAMQHTAASLAGYPAERI